MLILYYPSIFLTARPIQGPEGTRAYPNCDRAKEGLHPGLAVSLSVFIPTANLESP